MKATYNRPFADILQFNEKDIIATSLNCKAFDDSNEDGGYYNVIFGS